MILPVMTSNRRNLVALGAAMLVAMHWLFRIMSVALVLPQAACESPWHGEEMRFAARPVQEVSNWRVGSGDRLAGWLRLLEMKGPDGDASFFRVDNAQGQWLGFIDRQGRVYQRMPFSMEEVFRGIYTMKEALSLLFEEPGPFSYSASGKAGSQSAVDRGDVEGMISDKEK